MSWIQMLAATFTIVRWKQKCCLHHVHCASDSHIRSFLTTWRREVTVIHGFQKEIKTPVRPDSYWKSDLNLLLQTEGEVNGTLWTPSFIDSPTLFAFGEAGDAFKTYFSSHCKGSCICLTALAWWQHHHLMWLSKLLLPRVLKMLHFIAILLQAFWQLL